MITWFKKNRRKISMALMFAFIMSLAVVMNVSAEDATTTSTLTTLESAIGFVWDQFTKMAELVTSKPILLLPVAVFAAGAAIGLVKRLIS